MDEMCISVLTFGWESYRNMKRKNGLALVAGIFHGTGIFFTFLLYRFEMADNEVSLEREKKWRVRSLLRMWLRHRMMSEVVK